MNISAEVIQLRASGIARRRTEKAGAPLFGRASEQARLSPASE
jgi:hypothetical protein